MSDLDLQLGTVVIYDSILFDRGHMVRRWADAVERRYTANAIAYAPVNKRVNKSPWDEGYPPGSLKASISGEVTRVGPKHLQTVISVDVPYAVHVIFGTGWIVPTSAKRLRLPFNAGYTPMKDETTAFGKPTYHPIVRGQWANDFLTLAHDATAMRHPSLRGHGASVFSQF